MGSARPGRWRCRRVTGSRELTGDDGGEHYVAEVAIFAGDNEAAAGDLRTRCDRLEALHRLNNCRPTRRCSAVGLKLGHEQDLVTQALWRQVRARVLDGGTDLSEVESRGRSRGTR
jgi:hypothetical protein